ncbi:MAG: tetratricopeptide repeat protein, partial [Planctomycetes bacterium]|nr:tetratricopeptide repeat protein [Planctomycetota bacterium]
MARSIPALLLTCLLFSGGCGQLWFPEQRAVEHYVSAMSHHVDQQDFLAIDELQAAVELDRDFSLAYSLMGDLYRENGHLEQAVDAYENAVSIDPWDFDDHF